MRLGIYTEYIDKYPRTAPSLYQAELIKRLSKIPGLEIILLHHRKPLSSRKLVSIYEYGEEVIIPRAPYLREKFLSNLHLDLIHFNAIPWSWYPSILRLGIPIVVTVHGTEHWDVPNLDPSPRIIKYLRKKFEQRMSSTVNHFIAISNHVKEVLVSKLGVPDNKISVVYLPIDHKVFKPMKYEEIAFIKQKYAIDTKYILHVSRFSLRKNPIVLFKTFLKVKSQQKDIILVIVGEGWKNHFIMKIVGRYGLSKNVKVLDWIPRKDLVGLYSGAEVCFLPSLHENFCFPIVESMACGCPVVASRAYAIPEVVDDAGLLCNPQDYECFANAILEILSNSQLREEMIERGLKRAKIFNWDDHIRKIVMVYKQVISKNRWE